jgi:hypothetical protein
MVDRRLVGILVSLTVAVIVAVAWLTGAASGPATAPATTGLSAQLPLPTSVSTNSPEGTLSVAASTAPSTESAASTSTVSADVPLVELVAAGRPPLPSGDVVDDGPADEAAASELDVVTSVVVAVWSWRFDDPPDRLSVSLTGLATVDVAAAWTASSAERVRRQEAGEVAWVLATPRPGAVGGAGVVVVDVEQHITSSTTPERVDRLTVNVRLATTSDAVAVVTGLEVTS